MLYVCDIELYNCGVIDGNIILSSYSEVAREAVIQRLLGHKCLKESAKYVIIQELIQYCRCCFITRSGIMEVREPFGLVKSGLNLFVYAVGLNSAVLAAPLKAIYQRVLFTIDIAKR
jgi:uncharacterized sodium:solute symporter family permease YidK